MKKWAVLLMFALLIVICVSASAVTYPVYGRCIANKVNVRVSPDNIYPTRGQLIQDAPITVVGEDGDTYLCETALGKGYIPKLYVELFENMTYTQFREYSKNNPSQYVHHGPGKKKSVERDWELLELYYNHKITEKTLLENWYTNPKTGEPVLQYNWQRNEYEPKPAEKPQK